jgi:hypothetical protein
LQLHGDAVRKPEILAKPDKAADKIGMSAKLFDEFPIYP